jgi:D-alanine-D-alanine ligase
MTDTRLSVGLLFGGESPEHEVSIVSARSIAANLDPARFEVRPMGIARNGVWVMNGDPMARLAAGELPQRSEHPFLPLEQGAEATPLPDVFFNAIHGAGGEDGQIQGYLEPLHRPYTGAGLLAMAAALDKWITKRIWESGGLPVVPYQGLTEEHWRKAPQPILRNLEALGLPVFVKPANLGSSIGIEKVGSREDLPAALDRAFGYDRRVLVEQGVDARELEVAVLGGDDPFVSVPGEILVAGEFYDFKDKYLDGKSSVRIPAELPQGMANLITQYAVAAFRALDAYGMARVDFFLDRATGRIFLNEINLIPGFTSISMYPKLMEASGIAYPDLLSRLIDLAILRHAEKTAKTRFFQSGSRWFE